MERSSIKNSRICDPRKTSIWKFSSFDIQGKMWAVGFSLLFVMLVWFSAGYRWDYPSKVKVDLSRNVYGIIFDAGSTGSRVHIFKFLKSSEGKQMELISDTFKEIKPGLSAYAADPQKAAYSLKPLLELAKSEVPEYFHSSCPIALKATAGLRLLGDQIANTILQKVKKLFMEYNFKMSENNIEIMSGSDEGIFSWITVNYLQNLLGTPEETVVALDLGGGSTQITFVPTTTETLQDAGEDFTKSVTLFGQKYSLYTHSYLGLGLMSARFEVMQKYTDDAHKLTTPCLESNTQISMTYAGVNYSVSSSVGGRNYLSCYASTSKLVKENMKSVAELNNHQIMAFSYFYDRAIDSNLIGTSGGNVTVDSFVIEAAKACNQQNKEKPLLCLDLSYILAMLKDGYVLAGDKVIELTKQIKGVEVSWALGAVFDLFSKAKVNYKMELKERESPVRTS